MEVWWHLSQRWQVDLLGHSAALWFPAAQLKHRRRLANTCLRSDAVVTSEHSFALWLVSSQYTHPRTRTLNSFSRRRDDWSSTGCFSIGLHRVHKVKASVSFTKSQLSHSGTVRTKSPRIAGSLSSVMDTFPFIFSRFPIVSSDCTAYDKFSQNSWILLVLTLGIVGRSKICLV